jgi:large subunit ribosomal protein L10
MNPDKKVIVEQLLTRINKSPYVLLVDYTGMTVPQFNEIRKRLRGVGSNLHVTKNSYVKAAGSDRGFPAGLNADLKGQTAIVFGEEDVCKAAQVVKKFRTETKKPGIKSAVLDGTLLTPDKVESLADVGSREDLLATLLGVLNAPGSSIARAIRAKAEKDAEGSSTPAATAEAPAAEAPAAEAPAAEAPAAEAAPEA